MVRKLLILAVAAAAIGLGVFWIVTIPATISASALAHRAPNLENGKEMFYAGGCTSCHAVPGQDDKTKLGGGLGLKSPFGTFYAPNISSDPKDGIGSWTEAQFVTAMQKGTSPDGRQWHFLVAVVPLQEGGRTVGFAGSAVDVSERVASDVQLQRQLAFSGLLLELSPLPVSMFDTEGRYVMVNQAWEELVGRPRKPYLAMQGYFNQPQATLEAWRNLWFHTGDLLRRDAAGNYFYIDRKKDRIRRRGENVSSSDIERSAAAHPAIAECVVLAHAAGAGEDDIRLIAVLKAGCMLAPAELHAWLKAQLPKFMWPRYIEIVDTLPRTGTNKVEKNKLAQQGLSANVWDAGA